MRSATVCAPLVAALLAGCSGPKTADLTPHPVTGKVTYDGKPAAGVKVTLVPTDAPMVPKIPQNPHAVTRADGTFAVTTFTDGDGAAEGGYQLVLTWPPDPAEKAAKADSSDEAQDADRLMGWYDPLHTTLSVRVKPGANEVPPINIAKIAGPPPVAQGVPGRN
jgi:hypothetical protein